MPKLKYFGSATTLAEKPLFTYFQALYLSFCSVNLYLDVAKRWKGMAMGYFLLVMMILSVPWSISYYHKFNQFIYDEWLYPIETMPVLMVQNGEVFVDKPMPVIVNNRAGEPTIKIDTRSDQQTFSDKYPTLSIFITKHRLLFRAPINQLFQASLSAKYTDMLNIKSEVNQYQFHPNDNEVFNGRQWVRDSGEKSIRKFVGLLSYPFTFGALLGIYFVGNFILASVARILAVVVIKYKVTYKQSLRLIWVASTPPLFFINLFQLLGFSLSNYSFYYCILVICYFSFAVACLKNENRYLVRR